MYLTESESQEAVRVIKQSMCDDGVEVEVFPDGSLDVYFPVENTGFALHSASNGEIIKAIMYFKDYTGGWKDIHAYVEEYIGDIDKYEYLNSLLDRLDEMSVRLEKEVERAFKERRNKK